MKMRISDVQIIPIKPKDGLVAFANVIFDEDLFLGSMGIYTRPGGSYRITYPKKGPGEGFNVFHPINRSTAQEIEDAVIGKYEEFMEEVNNMREAI